MPVIRDEEEERRARIQQMIANAEALHEAAVRRINAAQKRLNESEAVLTRLKHALKKRSRRARKRKR